MEPSIEFEGSCLGSLGLMVLGLAPGQAGGADSMGSASLLRWDVVGGRRARLPDRGPDVGRPAPTSLVCRKHPVSNASSFTARGSFPE